MNFAKCKQSFFFVYVKQYFVDGNVSANCIASRISLDRITSEFTRENKNTGSTKNIVIPSLRLNTVRRQKWAAKHRKYLTVSVYRRNSGQTGIQLFVLVHSPCQSMSVSVYFLFSFVAAIVFSPSDAGNAQSPERGRERKTKREEGGKR